MAQHLDVLLNDVLAGHLRDEGAGRASFRLARRYVELPRRPILGQMFEDEPDRVWLERRGVPRWFANVLPEAGSPLRSLLAEAHEIDSEDDLEMLAVLGNDLPGAVIIRGSDEDLPPEPAVPDQESTIGEEQDVLPRFSLAGVQLKLSVLMSGDRLTLPGPGEFGNAIIKLTRGELDGIAENEATMMAWARAAGFDVANARLVHVPDLPIRSRVLDGIHTTALVVERFDRRPGGIRVHQEDFAQVTHRPPQGKYEHITFEQLGAVARGILGDDGFLEYIRRLTLVIAQGNADAHLKNWSLQYLEPSRANWSPLYDQVCTRAWAQVDNRLALKLGGRKHFGQVDEAAFHWLAQKAGMDRSVVVDCAVDVVNRLRAVFQGLPEVAHMRSEHIRRLVEHWSNVPFLRGVGPLA